MEPLVSVIIPVYNVAPWLREALDSVIDQTYRNLEIIIVDDGSADGSGEICDEYVKDPRVRVIHQENNGLSGARNTGLDAMSGDCVAFLDPDDMLHPEMIEQMLQAITRTGADLAVCGYEIFSDDDPRNGIRNVQNNPEKDALLTGREALNALLEGNLSMVVWNKLYKKELWEDLRFPEGHVYEDIRTMPKIFARCEIVAMIPQILVSYRERRESITHTFTKQYMLEQSGAYKESLAVLEKIQPRFPSASFQIFRENSVRRLIMKWAHMRKEEDSSEAVSEVKEEILRFAGEVPAFRQFRTKVMWQMFLHCPGMLLPARECYRWAKRFLGRGRAG